VNDQAHHEGRTGHSLLCRRDPLGIVGLHR
jgi:hypothetical protein